MLNIKQKLQVCDFERNGLTYAQILVDCGIRKSSMFDIIKSEDKVKIFHSQLQSEDCTKKSMVNKVVHLWFTSGSDSLSIDLFVVEPFSESFLKFVAEEDFWLLHESTCDCHALYDSVCKT